MSTETKSASIDLQRIPVAARHELEALLMEVLEISGDVIEGVYLIGAACSEDFIPGQSSINTLFLLRREVLLFVQAMASLGSQLAGPNVVAPVILTREDIFRSLDVFPVEFLDWRSQHLNIYFDGEEEGLLANLEIDSEHLRLQCERELRVRLLGLRENYIASGGIDQGILSLFSHTIPSYFPLLKAMLHLGGHEMPNKHEEILQGIQDNFDIVIAPLREALDIHWGLSEPQGRGLRDLFRRFYRTVEELMLTVDGMAQK